MEERIKKLEIITERIARKNSKVTSKAYITPFPISNAVFGDEINGVVLTYLFPSDGKITKGMVKLGSKPKDEITICINIFNDYNSESKGFTVNKKNNDLKIDRDVKSGDCLKVTVNPKGETIIKEVWIAFLWKPTVGSSIVKQFLLEEPEGGN
jgi:hypothetical protein